jgi:hypothetical protein
MSTYTTVDEGFTVDIYKSFVSLWKDIDGNDYYLEADNQKPLTKALLKEELKEFNMARLYQEDSNDWTLKIQIHS